MNHRSILFAEMDFSLGRIDEAAFIARLAALGVSGDDIAERVCSHRFECENGERPSDDTLEGLVAAYLIETGAVLVEMLPSPVLVFEARRPNDPRDLSGYGASREAAVIDLRDAEAEEAIHEKRAA